MFEGGNQNLLRINDMQEKKIVIVDDDDSIRKTFFMILHDNYRVYLAKDPKEALHRFKKANVDLIIADLNMPVMGGRELYEKIIACKPNLYNKLIFSTGDSVNEDTRAFLKETGRPFLPKPFNLIDVKEMVDKIVNEEPVPQNTVH